MIWLSIIPVGAGSHLFRSAPLMLLPRVDVPIAVDRAVRRAGTCAITALTVSTVAHQASEGSAFPLIAAVAIGLLLAARDASMQRVVTVGATVYLLLGALSAPVS